ncbi:MAG TPA: PA2778 family cysteine peptidase [Burkholderiales bacterium]|nr:PA2778 family cysteine peptidase [Burkholderiales bacterium]
MPLFRHPGIPWLAEVLTLAARPHEGSLRRLLAPGLAAGLLLAVLLAGCAGPQARALLAQPPAGLPERVELEHVPFYPQQRYQCGPAALATVLVHSGVAVTPEALVPQVYLPAREGSLQAEMLAAARRHGRLAYALAPRLADVLAEVAAGTPVVVLQNLSPGFFPRWHYAVVVGYDLAREEIVLRSGTTRRLAMALAAFERSWARSGHWAMLVAPPGKLPATAVEQRYLTAAAALERSAPEAAQAAYATALERWPANLLALIGRGNAAYAMKDLAAAEAAYREAIRHHPQAADAWNNLAQVLSELGRREEALAAAERAVAIGGPRLAHYQRTLQAIAGAR